MKFAKFWQEVEISVDQNFFGLDKISVWGASNKSNAEAGNIAVTRAARFKELISSEDLTLHDYEYWNGFIREEVIDEIKSSDGKILAVITRNNYGALVINSESIFFGDIDVKTSSFLDRVLEKFGKARKDKNYYLARVEEFQKKNPEYTIKVYETCAGLRVVITNQLFDSQSSVTDKIFKSLDTDPLYVRLCKSQSCFRARLTPKPWRVGIERPTSRFPRTIHRDRDEFNRWLQSYQSNSQDYAVVRILKVFGHHRSHIDVERLLMIHDKYACSASAVLA